MNSQDYYVECLASEQEGGVIGYNDCHYYIALFKRARA